MKTTYQLTADNMIQDYGKQEALALAVTFSIKGVKSGTQHFWRYVAQCIQQAE